MEVLMGAEIQLGLSICVVLTVYFLPHHTSLLMRGEL
jgi:hypothetical protein